MQLKSYKEILAMGKDKVNETLAPVRARKAKKQAELEIAKMEEDIATQEAKIMELCSKQELNFDAIIKAQDTYALTERRIKQFEKIIEEMFPEKDK